MGWISIGIHAKPLACVQKGNGIITGWGTHTLAAVIVVTSKYSLSGGCHTSEEDVHSFHWNWSCDEAPQRKSLNLKWTQQEAKQKYRENIFASALINMHLKPLLLDFSVLSASMASFLFKLICVGFLSLSSKCPAYSKALTPRPFACFSHKLGQCLFFFFTVEDTPMGLVQWESDHRQRFSGEHANLSFTISFHPPNNPLS